MTVRRFWFLVFPLLFLALSVLALELRPAALQAAGVQPDTKAAEMVTYTLRIAFWLGLAWVVSRFFNILVWDTIVGRSTGGRVPNLLKTVSGLFFASLAITAIVGVVFQLPIVGFFATSSVVGLVVGFALRNIINDVFSGVALNIDRPFVIGDWITVHSMEREVVGRVEEVNWRTTRIRTEDNNWVVLPNGSLGSAMITNHWSPGKESRYDVSFWLDFSVAHDRARRVLLGAVWAVAGRGPIMDKPEPQVILAGTSDLGVEYRIRYWTKPWDDASPTAARDVVIRSVLDHLRHAGISLAYPKEDIYFEPMPSRQLNATTIADRELLLRVIPLFQSLTREELQYLAQHMHEHQYPEGTVLFTQGDPGRSMFIVFEGLLKMTMNIENGEPEAAVGQFAPGQWFGEVSLLTGDVREATVRARTESMVYEITKEHLDALFDRRPELVEKLATALVDRMVEMSRIADETSRDRAAAGSVRHPGSKLSRVLARVRGAFKTPH